MEIWVVRIISFKGDRQYDTVRYRVHANEESAKEDYELCCSVMNKRPQNAEYYNKVVLEKSWLFGVDERVEA